MRFSLYGLPQFAISATEVFLRLHLLIYLTQFVKMGGQQAGLIVSGSLVLSALFDPLIGRFSDDLKASKGRVTGFIVLSLLIMCLFICLLFLPSWSSEQFFILFLLCLGYQVSYSSFLIPYLSLAKSLIQEEKDIVSLYAWRYLFGSLGALIGISFPFLNKIFDTEGYFVIALAMIFLILVLAPASLKLLKEKKQTSAKTRASKNLGKQLTSLFKNQVFLGYYLTFTILSIGLGLNQTLALYFYKFGLKLTEDETNILLGFYMLVFCISIPFWTKFSENYGKKRALSIGLSVITLVTLFYPFLPERNLIALYSVVTFAGLFTGIVALIDSYLSNVIDFHTLRENEKQANLIFGVWRISDKLSRATGIFIAGIVLDLTINNNQASFTINQAFGYGVFIFLFPATLIFTIQKYADKHHDKVIRILTKKNPSLLYKAEELES